MAADSNSIIKNLYSKFKYGDIVIRLLYLNIGVFLIISLCGLICTLFNLLPVRWVSYLMFPASVERFVYQPWSIFSYMFVHVDVFHVLFNMIWLYWFGRLFLDFFSSKHLRGLYILGGVMGALAYMLAYHVFPYFSNSVDVACVTGASGKYKVEQDETQRNMNKLSAEYVIRKQAARTIAIIAVLAIVLMLMFCFIVLKDISRSNHYRKELEKSKLYAENLLTAREKLIP